VILKSGTKTGGIILRILKIVMGLNAEKMPLWVEHKYYAEGFTEAIQLSVVFSLW
jgi:hypothetical protein